MLNDEDRTLAIHYLNKNFKGDLNKMSSVTNLSTEEIKSYLNFYEDAEKAKSYLNSINAKDFEKKLSSLAPEELGDLIKLLEKLN